MSLPSTKATSATATHAVVQAVESYIQNQNLLGEIAELDDLLSDLIDLHKDNEVALRRILHSIHNLLLSNNKYNVKFGAKVFHKLIAIVIADGKDKANPNGLQRQLVANVLACVQIHVRKFPRIDGKFLLRQLWSLSLSSESQPYAAQILVQLFDDFVRELGKECTCSPELYAVVQHLLQSEAREYRKSAYFLLNKLLVLLQAENEHTEDSCANPEKPVQATFACTEQQLFAYVAIMECLEEQQSHLMLPTLNTLLPRIATGNPRDAWRTWQTILYTRLLQENNILVLRWTLTYFLNHFDLVGLCCNNLLAEFLTATNRTQLYNVEGSCLPGLDIVKFMSKGDAQLFLETLSSVPWNSVPLVFWLRNLESNILPSTGKNVLLKLSSRVRTLKNPDLRKIANRRLFELFVNTIDNMKLHDYLILIETLFNASDNYYNDHKRLTRKMQDCKNCDEEFMYFNKRCYEIIISECAFYSDDVVYEFIRQMEIYPNVQHGCWRLFLCFRYINRYQDEITLFCLKFLENQFGVTIESLKSCANLSDMQEYMLRQLKCQTKEEKLYVREQCVDLFVQYHVKSWRQLEELHRNPLDLEQCCTKETFRYVQLHLKDFSDRSEHKAHALPVLINLLNTYQACDDAAYTIFSYAEKYLNDADYETLTESLSSSRNELMHSAVLSHPRSIPRSFIIRGLTDGDASTGDARIEEAYAHKIVREFHRVTLRNMYMQCSYIDNPSDEMNAIFVELMRINNQLTAKKPRYFENCKEHRVKMRIARALLQLSYNVKWSDELWTALLAPNDQLNISFMYECLVGKLMPTLDMLLELLQPLGTLMPSQQVSVISVVHIYCERIWTYINTEDLQEIIDFLLPLTMGAHFQTRLLAQLVLYRFAEKLGLACEGLPVLYALKTSIERTLGSKLEAYLNDSRLLLPQISHHHSPGDVILYMTNAPFDEYDIKWSSPGQLKERVEGVRAFFRAKTDRATIEMPAETANLNVQRKMNPVNDIYNSDDFDRTDKESSDHGLLVVASLIDKLPNLGGLARTCEVLGVQTLILGSKSHAEKSDFTNLSMTAEKTLNIAEVKPAALKEFLIEKQSMGYKIVGAEQTAHSVSFTDFKFPHKCILLLGHEKHGIPVDLIALLDYAVEIPQFGLVRSLNVHVTGSLFIWEYCKQHMQS